MNYSDNVAAGLKRSVNDLDMEDDCNSNNSSLNSSEPYVKKQRVSCYEKLHQSILNSKSPMEQSKNDTKKAYLLVITNSGGDWTCDQVMNYVREEIGENALLVNDFQESETDFQIKLKFPTMEQRNHVLEKLKIKQAEGKLCVKIEDTDNEDISPDFNLSSDNIDVNLLNKSVDIWDVNPNSLYGLRESFLESLDITPPLSNWVLVTSFRCDKSELKEVMELAGHVVVCTVVTAGGRYANVMYSHPLEAVQAISMLDGQTLYGKNLKIKMDNTPEYKKLLPKGLTHLGPGLGKYGKPVRDVTKQYERFISGKDSLIETKIFKTDNSYALLKAIMRPFFPRPTSRSSHNSETMDNTQDKLENDIRSRKYDDTSPITEPEKQVTAKSDSPKASRGSTLDMSYFHNQTITNFTLQPNKYAGNESSVNPNGNVKVSESHDTIRQNSPSTVQVQSNNQMDTNQELNGKGIVGLPNTGLNVAPNQQMYGPIQLANGQITGNIRPFPNTQGAINVPHRPMGNFGPMVQNMQGMQGPFARQIPNQIGMSRQIGVQNVQNQHVPIHTLSRVPVPANPGIGSQGFGPNQGRAPVASLLPYPAQMAGPGFLNPGVPRGPTQGPILYSNSTNARMSGSYMQQPSVRPLEIYRGVNAFSLKIVHIPPTIKLGGLCDKLSEFGQVRGLEFESPGCAIVKFVSADDADRCFRNYRQVFHY